MRIVFFGTPVFAVPSLEALLALGESVVAVVTRPDRPRGRSHSKLEPSPVKRRAIQADLPVLEPDRPVGEPFLEALAATGAELGVVVAYGHLLKPAVLSIPRLGMINVHASLLPRWRGAAPIQWSILAGDRETGISIMRMDPGLDSGPVLHRVATPIGPDETGGELTGQLAGLGAAALTEVLTRWRSEEPSAEPQADRDATYAAKIDRELARIRWDEPAEQVARRIRAFDPAPGAWTRFCSGEIKLFRPSVRGFSGPPGSVLVVGPELVIAAGRGSVAIGEVQPAGKTRIPTGPWLRGAGRSVALGERFG